jgi:hypothetical protein
LDTSAFEQERHTGASRVVRSRAVENDFESAGKPGAYTVEIAGVRFVVPASALTADEQETPVRGAR